MNKPIKLSPAFKDYLWGGTKLRDEFGKKCDFEKVAESWELSTHPDGPCYVASGEDTGMTFPDYIKKHNLIGKKAEAFDFFPILIKFIDAKDSLSIQVHPSDEYALKNENSFGKTEMWYILDCEEDAFLYYGLKKEVSKEEFKERIENNTVLEVLNPVKVKKGDVFFIKSGTIHAIGAGIVICEIQQNSNLTYRVYDFDRRDKEGNPRELHVEKALKVSDLCPAKPYVSDKENVLAECKYFTVEKHVINGEADFQCAPDCFRCVIATDGDVTLEMNDEVLTLKKGETAFIPACDGSYKLSGSSEIIIAYV